MEEVNYKCELERTVEILERQRFLDVYTEFDRWLLSFGFRSANTKESMEHLNYHWVHYDKHIDSLYSVECYLHDTLKLSIHFLRDRYEHKFIKLRKSYEETNNEKRQDGKSGQSDEGI
jgi:hypothetical protein